MANATNKMFSKKYQHNSNWKRGKNRGLNFKGFHVLVCMQELIKIFHFETNDLQVCFTNQKFVVQICSKKCYFPKKK